MAYFTKKQKRLVIVLIVLGVLIMSGLIWLSYETFLSDGWALKLNWGIDLPRSAKRTFSVSDTGGFTGDGYRYAVYNYTEHDDNFDAEFNQGGEYSKGICEHFNAIADGLDVPDSERPDFAEDYSWRSGSRSIDERDELYIIYQDGKLYIAESML